MGNGTGTGNAILVPIAKGKGCRARVEGGEDTPHKGPSMGGPGFASAPDPSPTLLQNKGK